MKTRATAENKVCTKCKKKLPLTEFYNNRRRKDGKQCRCKKCSSEAVKKYQDSHKDKVLAYQREYRRKNKAKIKERRKDYHREYYAKHKDRINEQSKLYHAQHREEKLIYMKTRYREHRDEEIERGKKYYKEHREDRKAYSRAYYREHKEQELARGREYRKTPAGKATARRHNSKWRAKRKGSRVDKRMPNNYEETIFENQEGQCYYCKRSLVEFGQQLDHKTPITRDGTHSFDNLALACPRCNRLKWAMTEEEFWAIIDGYSEEELREFYGCDNG